MNMGLAGKAVIVTGAASGIGAAIAAACAQEGIGGLMLTDRDGSGLARIAAELSPLTRVETVQADLADIDAPGTIAKAALARFGRIDGLVNAAALTTRASFLDGDPATWSTLFDVNARAAFFLMQAAISDMLARSSGGAIVNILSVNVHCGAPELAIYAASKGALATLTRNAANAHMADRIRVNGINLGWAATPGEHKMQAETLGRGNDWLAEASAKMPLGRLITPQECARLAVFLLGEASVPMSGAVIDFEQRVTGAI